MISQVIVEKLIHRFNTRVYIKEIDDRRNDYCTQLAIEEMAMVGK